MNKIINIINFFKSPPSYGEKSESIGQIQEVLADYNLYDKSKVDKIYGPATEMAVKDLLEAYELKRNGVVSLISDNPLDYRTTNDLGTVPLRPEGKNRYMMTKDSNQVIVIHWTAGPTTAKSLYDMFARTDRAVSSHFAIDPTGTYQYLPSTRRAYHAGWINKHAIGIDICQPVQAKRKSDSESAGYVTEIVDNPTARGDKKVIRLDDKMAEETAKLILTLCDIHNIEVKFPESEEVIFTNSSELGNWSGIVGHHHVSSRKWDVAPWMRQIKDSVDKLK